VLFPAGDSQEWFDSYLENRHSGADDEVGDDCDGVPRESAKLSDPIIPARNAAIITGFSVNRSTRNPAVIDITPWAMKQANARKAAALRTSHSVLLRQYRLEPLGARPGASSRRKKK